jgi:hypothetical protein
VVAFGWAVACSEEGVEVGENQCGDLPLYRWKLTDAGSWERQTIEGEPLSQADKDAIKKAEAHCTTPLGTNIGPDEDDTPPPPSDQDGG